VTDSPNVTGIKELSTQGWVSLKKAAILIGVSYPTALKLKNEGLLQVIKVGGTHRVYASEIQRYLREGNLPRSEITNK